MVSQIYPSELQLNKANASDTEAAFLDLHLSISNDIVSTKIYDKRDDFDFEIVNFPFLDGDVPRSTSYGVYISQLIRFASRPWAGYRPPPPPQGEFCTLWFSETTLYKTQNKRC